MASRIPVPIGLAAELDDALGQLAGVCLLLLWAMIPSGMAMTIATTIAATANSIVAGIRSTMTVVTGWFVRSETPRSPRTTPFAKLAYC